jgi:hypothetical protein
MTVLNVCLMSCAEIFANSHLQKYAGNKVLRNLLLGILGYVGVLFFLIKSFGHGNMLWVTTMWEGMIIVLSASFAYFYLGERFSHPVQYLGIILGILAMCCVHYGGSLS